MSLLLAGATIVGTLVFGATTVTQPVEVEGAHLRYVIVPSMGGTMPGLGFLETQHNLAAGGMIHEGFGSESVYEPNRRLNEVVEVLDDNPDQPTIRYRYDCEGPNIQGLYVERSIAPVPGAASVEVVWSIENRSGENRWVAPWVTHYVSPGGTVDAADRIDMPTVSGVVQPQRSTFALAARNWIAATDTTAQETVYGVFNAADLHSFKAIVDIERGQLGLHAAFVPRMFGPGDTWRTSYRITAVRGLRHVDFATDELAGQIDYLPGELQAIVSAAKPFTNTEMRASILGRGQDMWRLEPRTFSIDFDRLMRVTYAWNAPYEGAFDFLAQFRQGGTGVVLGESTGSPHGGIDTTFRTGPKVTGRMEPWTDAVFRLDRTSRTLKRPLALSGGVTAWFESPLTKIFTNDRVEPADESQTTYRVSLARNERESFQLVLLPANDVSGLRIQLSDLLHASGTRLGAEHFNVRRVGYVPVRIPSHFANASGFYPDPLLPAASIALQAGRTQPLWFSVYAARETLPGTYSGSIAISGAGLDPVRLRVEVEVQPFLLPVKPSLRTDFGFDEGAAYDASRAMGYTGTTRALREAYRRNALEHRVTLREPASVPLPSPTNRDAMDAFEARVRGMIVEGTTAVAVSPIFLGVPDRLEAASNFIARLGLAKVAFVPFPDDPFDTDPVALRARMREWRVLAPAIPIMIRAAGLQPVLPETAELWNIHSRMMDTRASTPVYERIQDDRDVWWYVDETPARPYANFFTDFAAIEHRVFFWQSWALRMTGVHYGNVSRILPGTNPYQGHVDATPANGNGLLVYPGPDGPVDSIRWETIRDGMEDFEYLAQFADRIHRLERRYPDDPLIPEMRAVSNLSSVIPDLTRFTRTPAVLEAKRAAIADGIVRMDARLKL